MPELPGEFAFPAGGGAEGFPGVGFALELTDDCGELPPPAFTGVVLLGLLSELLAGELDGVVPGVGFGLEPGEG